MIEMAVIIAIISTKTIFYVRRKNYYDYIFTGQYVRHNVISNADVECVQRFCIVYLPFH